LYAVLGKNKSSLKEVISMNWTNILKISNHEREVANEFAPKDAEGFRGSGKGTPTERRQRTADKQVGIRQNNIARRRSFLENIEKRTGNDFSELKELVDIQEKHIRNDRKFDFYTAEFRELLHVFRKDGRLPDMRSEREKKAWKRD